jgi:hypothetical protein
MLASLSYQAYLERMAPFLNDQNSEGGSRYHAIDEATWNRMSDRERFQNMPDANGTGVDGGGWQSADEDATQAFRAKFGDSLNNNVEVGNQAQDSHLIYGYGDPKLYGHDFKDWAADPSRIVYLPDGRFVIEANNIKGDKLAEFQHADSESGVGDGKNWTILAAAVLGGGALLGASGALGAEAAGTTGTAVGGDALAGTEIANTYAAGANPVAFSGNAADLAATGGATVGGAPVIDVGADIPLNTTNFTGTPLEPTPALQTPGTPVAPTTPAAPATPTAPAAPAAPTPATPATPPGVIDSATTNPLSRVGSWYNSLSPAARLVLSTGVSAAAQAALGANAQRHAQEAAAQQEEQQRQDHIRRGFIPAFGSAFTPKTAGIINSRRGG